MSEVRLRFQVEGPWKYLTITVGVSSIRIGGFDDGTDWLGDTVRAALTIVTRGWSADATYDGEPEGWHLAIQRDPSRPEILNLKMLEYPDIRGDLRDSGKVLFEARCEADSFGHAVAESAEAILSAYGDAGYQKLTRLETFPLRALRALRTALDTKQASRRARATQGPITGFAIGDSDA